MPRRDPPTPPRLARALLALVLPARDRAAALSDLDEEFESRCQRTARRSATRWYRAQVWRSLLPSLRRRPLGATSPSPGSGRREPVGGLGRELRQAARSLRRTPWYAATIIAVVALSMTLATTVFAIVDGVLFRPLPYPDADELYAVGGILPPDVEPSGRGIEMLSPRELTAWSADAPRVLLTGLVYTSFQLPDGDVVGAVGIDERFFDVFRIQVQLGGLTGDDFAPDVEPRRVLISDTLWRSRFSGDGSVIGRVFRPRGFGATAYEIAGVMAPESFVPPLPTGGRIDAVLPSPLGPDFGERGLVAFARVPTDTLPEVRAALHRAATAYANTVPPLAANLTPGQRRARVAYRSVELQALSGYLTGRQRPTLALVFSSVIGLAALVLLNAGGLASARAAQQLRELSLRRALGARTLHLVRHAVAEQLVLASGGTAIGLSLCPLLLAAVVEVLPAGLVLIKDPHVDWRVAAFAALVTCTTSFLVALFPVRVALRGRPTPINEMARQAAGRVHLRRGLVAGQVALAFLMVLGGSFLATSLARVWQEDFGFRTEGTATVWLEADEPIPRQRALDVAALVAARPTVSAGVFDMPILVSRTPRSSFRRPGAEAPLEVLPLALQIGAGFFEAADVRLRRGRLPTSDELAEGARVLVVSETAARTYWPRQPALGQSLISPWRMDFEVVGVVADARWEAADVDPAPAIYLSWASLPLRSSTLSFHLFLALGDDPREALSAAVTGIQRDHPDLRIVRLALVEDAFADGVRARRLSALTASVFGAVALVIVSVGLLGIVAMTASRRTREVGIRMALGAPRSGVVRQLLGEQLGAVAVGILGGAALAVWAVGLIEAQLYETTTSDPAVWLMAISVMLATAVLGALIPAVRASRIDPVRALRQE